MNNGEDIINHFFFRRGLFIFNYEDFAAKMFTHGSKPFITKPDEPVFVDDINCIDFSIHDIPQQLIPLLSLVVQSAPYVFENRTDHNSSGIAESSQKFSLMSKITLLP